MYTHVMTNEDDYKRILKHVEDNYTEMINELAKVYEKEVLKTAHTGGNMRKVVAGIVCAGICSGYEIKEQELDIN